MTTPDPFDTAVAGLDPGPRKKFDDLAKDIQDELRRAAPPSLLAAYVELFAADWSSLERLPENLGNAVQLAKAIKWGTGPNSPSEDEVAGLWLALVQQNAKSHVSAARIGREWFRHLEGSDENSGTRSKHRAVAAYVVGAHELGRGNQTVARRWLQLAVIEDARSGHKGAARALLIEALGDTGAELDSLGALAHAAKAPLTGFEAQSEYILTTWYLSRDLRRSEPALDTEHELRGALLTKLIDNTLAKHPTTKAQGDALELLAAYLLAHLVGCYPIRKSSTPDFETDLVIRNLSRHVSPILDLLGRYFLVECKNWKDAVGSQELAHFANRIRYGRLTFGIMFAREGITGDSSQAGSQGTGARFMLNRAYHQDGVVIAVVTVEDLRRIARQDETLAQMLLRKHDEVRFGSYGS